MIVQELKVIQVSERWLNLIQFVRAHPYVTFEKLSFIAGEPTLANLHLKIEESIKF